MVNGLPAMSNSGLCGEKLNLTGILLGILLCSCLLLSVLREPKAHPFSLRLVSISALILNTHGSNMNGILVYENISGYNMKNNKA